MAILCAILEEIPFGSHRIEAGMCMRNGMLLNGILTNSEVWYGVLKKHVEKLEKNDELFLRSVLDSHSKTAIEALYIETGKIPIRFIIQKISQARITDAP